MMNFHKVIDDSHSHIDAWTASLDCDGYFHFRQGSDHLLCNRLMARRLRKALDSMIRLTMEEFRHSVAMKVAAIVACTGLITFFHQPTVYSLDLYKGPKLRHVVQVMALQPAFIPPDTIKITRMT